MEPKSFKANSIDRSRLELPTPSHSGIEGERNDRATGLQDTGPSEIEVSIEESRQIGHVKWSIYATYISAVGPFLTTVILVSLILMQVMPKLPAEILFTLHAVMSTNAQPLCPHFLSYLMILLKPWRPQGCQKLSVIVVNLRQTLRLC